jgi:hypothetical protein
MDTASLSHLAEQLAHTPTGCFQATEASQLGYP